MAYIRFGREIKGRSIKELNTMLEERKKELFKWNYPSEKMPMMEADGKGGTRAKSRHPYKKIKKEIAILNQRILILSR